MASAQEAKLLASEQEAKGSPRRRQIQALRARGLEAWSWDGGPLRGCRRGAQVDRFGGGICWASGRRGNRVSAREYSAIADSSGLRPHHDI